MDHSLGEIQRNKRDAAIVALREAMRAYERDTGKAVTVHEVRPEEPPEDHNLGAERINDKAEEYFKENSKMWRLHSDMDDEPSPAVKRAAQQLVDKYWDHEEPEEKNKDLTGKYMAGILEDFLPALKEIAKLGSMNNKPFGKYDRGSWQLVKDGETYYQDAMWRHILDGRFTIDPTTGMPNDIAIAWNNLALICFRLKREKENAAS